MTEPRDEADVLREELATLPELVRQPEEFGLRFLSVDELIDAAESGPVSLPAPRRSRRTWVIGAAAGLAAAAAVAVAVLPRADDGVPPVASPSPTASATPTPTTYDGARDVLLAAASVRGPETARVRYWHVKSIQTFGAEQVPREIWLGNGRPSVLDQEGFLDRLPATSFPVGGASAGWQELQQLPTDTAELGRLLARDAAPAGRDVRWTIFKAAGDLLAEAPLPPEVRAALWRVLAAQPGAERTDRTTDAAGRTGWTVSMSLPGEGRVTYVVDPASGELLEARHAAIGDRPAWSITYLERGPAESAPALSAG